MALSAQWLLVSCNDRIDGQNAGIKVDILQPCSKDLAASLAVTLLSGWKPKWRARLRPEFEPTTLSSKPTLAPALEHFYFTAI